MRIIVRSRSFHVDKCIHCLIALNPLIATLKPHSNGPSYRNTVICTLAVDGWAVTFGTARRGLGGTKCNSPPINGQCTNFVLFDVAVLRLASKGLSFPTYCSVVTCTNISKNNLYLLSIFAC